MTEQLLPTGHRVAATAADLMKAYPAYTATPVGQVHQFIEASGGNLHGSAPGAPAQAVHDALSGLLRD